MLRIAEVAVLTGRTPFLIDTYKWCHSTGDIYFITAGQKVSHYWFLNTLWCCMCQWNWFCQY